MNCGGRRAMCRRSASSRQVRQYTFFNDNFYSVFSLSHSHSFPLGAGELWVFNVDTGSWCYLLLSTVAHPIDRHQLLLLLPSTENDLSISIFFLSLYYPNLLNSWTALLWLDHHHLISRPKHVSLIEDQLLLETNGKKRGGKLLNWLDWLTRGASYPVANRPYQHMNRGEENVDADAEDA